MRAYQGVLVFCLAAVPSLAADPRPNEPHLDALLVRLGRVSDLYRDSALKFACDERIEDSGLGNHTYLFEYMYVYDDLEGFKDYRTATGAGHGPGGAGPVDLTVQGVPRYLRQAYSWVFVFSERRRKLHRYEFLGVDEALGKPAFKIRFDPIAPYREDLNNWFGTAWIDRETLHFLRVEAFTPDSYAKQKEFEKDVATASTRKAGGERRRYLIERVSTDFSIEKNGMRFPGRVLIDMTRYAVGEHRRGSASSDVREYRVEQTYTNYRFFTIRSVEEIRGIISEAMSLKGSKR